MSIRPRLTPLAAGVLAAVAQLAASPASADSAVGVDTSISGSMNTGVARGSVAVDRDFEPLRSPVGLLFQTPPAQSEPRARTPGGWQYDANAEFGWLGSSGDTRNPLFRRYRDVDDALYVRYFGASAEQDKTARFVETEGGSVGRRDQFYSLSFGRYNDWKLALFYNQTPTTFTGNYHSLWSGIGSAGMTLDGLRPGGLATAAASQTAIQSALATTPATELGILRKKGGVRYDLALGENWKLYASFTSEKREGSRPYGMVFGGGGGGGNIEIPESIDSATHEILAGLRYNDAVQSFNLDLSASLFRNDITTMTVQNPLTITTNTITGVPAGTFTYGRFAADPSNEYYKARAEYARALPSLWNGRLTASFAAARSRQNQALVEPTLLPLTGGTINGISAANAWNTSAALQRSTADAQIDTLLGNVALIVNPLPALSVKGHVRYYSTDNSTDYTACNPLTSQWGRLLNDGSGGAFVNTPAYIAARCDLEAARALGIAPSAGNINIRSIPYEYQQTNYGVQADYRLSARSNATLLLEREDMHREHRERDRTWEDRVKVGYTNRALGDVTLLASYEYDRRRGGEYVADPYEPFYSASMGPYPTANGSNMASWIHNIDSFRKFDLADRDQDILNARVNWSPTADLDVGLSANYRGMRYPESAYGRTGTNGQTTVNLNVNYQPATDWSVYGFYTWQEGRLRQRGLQPNGCVIGTTYYFYSSGAVNTTGVAPAGTTLVGTSAVTSGNWQQLCEEADPLSPLFPSSRAWTVQQKSTNQTAGIGGHYDFVKARLDGSYFYAYGRTATDYTYNGDGLGLSAAQLALIGTGLPAAVYAQHTLQASLTVPIDRTFTARLYYSYERGRITDWHYDGVSSNPVPANNAVYLDYGPQDYHANLFGVFLQVKF